MTIQHLFIFSLMLFDRFKVRLFQSSGLLLHLLNSFLLLLLLIDKFIMPFLIKIPFSSELNQSLLILEFLLLSLLFPLPNCLEFGHNFLSFCLILFLFVAGLQFLLLLPKLSLLLLVFPGLLLELLLKISVTGVEWFYKLQIIRRYLRLGLGIRHLRMSTVLFEFGFLHCH